jgi:hypothetical protein
MNYKKIYEEIILKAKHRESIEGYTERHHVVPRSLGGSNDTTNLVTLTAREHFICHYLLTKCYKPKTNNYYKMLNAFIIMKCGHTKQYRYFNSYLYESAKTKYSNYMKKAQKGKKNSQYGSMWIFNWNLKQSKKIFKDDFSLYELDGWEKGRKFDFKTYDLICSKCGKKFKSIKKLLTCSEKCRRSMSNKNGISEEDKEKLFVKFYIKHKSSNKALKLMGYPGNVGAHNGWSKKVIKKYKLLQ